MEAAQTFAASRGLTVAGLHTHLGSDILQAEPFLKALDILLNIAGQFEDLEYIDLGGGLGVPFAPGDHSFDLLTYGQAVQERFSDWRYRYAWPLAL